MRKLLFITTLAILIPFIVFGFLGCMKAPDHSPNYGPEVTWEQIQKVWTLDTPPEPLSMTVGQYVSLNYTQVVDIQSPEAFRQRSDEVKNRIETDQEIQWNFFTKENVLDGRTGQWKSSEQNQEPLYYVKNSTQALLEGAQAKTFNPSSTAKNHFQAFTLRALKTADETDSRKVTYHNLKREEGYLPVPQVVRNKPNCGGVKNCDLGLRYMRISFDRVVWESEAKGTKTAYRITYSPDVPTYIADWDRPSSKYPTNQYQFCAQTWIELSSGTQTQVVPVMECSEVVDFKFGS